MNKISLLALTGTLAFAAPAIATPQTLYFSCPTGTVPRVANNTTARPTWTQTAPATDFADGGGCAWFDPGFLASTDPTAPSTLADMQLGGTYNGEVAELDFTLYLASGNPAYRQANLPIGIDVDLVVNGEVVTGATELEAPAEPGPQPGTYKVSYSLGDLDIPETTRAKNFSIVVAESYFDDETVWMLGAKDFPASATAYSALDLPPDA